MGRPFAAIIRLNKELKMEFDFGQGSSDPNGEAQAVDFSGQVPVGKCLKCGASVYENGMSYVCEKMASVPKTCEFRSGKIILQRTIEREQMAKLLQSGKTDLLHKFISKKGRPFSAYLVADKEGKVKFEFEERKPKAAANAKPAKSAPATAKPPEEASS